MSYRHLAGRPRSRVFPRSRHVAVSVLGCVLLSAASAAAQDTPPSVEPAAAPVAPAEPPPVVPTAEAPVSESAPAEAPAETMAPPEEPPPTEEPPPATPKPPPYSLPWQLRPVAAGNVVRSDTAIAMYKSPAGDSGTTFATTLLGSYKVTDSFAPLVRLGLVSNSPPVGSSGTTLTNPVIGGLYGLKLDDFRLGLFLGLALPLGGGGGNSPDPESRTAMLSGLAARSAMDNAMFAMNYFTVFPGVGFAYVRDGLTLQAEVTLLQLTRVKGELLDTDSSRTNFTSGLHAGYFFIPELSAGVELRHQRWISTPAPVRANSDARDTTTVAFGPRAHFKLGETTWLRPGVALALPVDRPMEDLDYVIVQLDIPFVF